MNVEVFKKKALIIAICEHLMGTFIQNNYYNACFARALAGIIRKFICHSAHACFAGLGGRWRAALPPWAS